MDRLFTAIANGIARFVGDPLAFILAFLTVVVWGVTGPMFHYSDTWQLVINTGTTIVTFLMVFLIQNTQNRDGAAIQAKLDELIRVGRAQNQFIGIEHLTESEVEEIRSKCEAAAERHDRKIAETAANKAVARKNGGRHAPKTTHGAAKKAPAGKNASKKKAEA